MSKICAPKVDCQRNRKLVQKLIDKYGTTDREGERGFPYNLFDKVLVLLKMVSSGNVYVDVFFDDIKEKLRVSPYGDGIQVAEKLLYGRNDMQPRIEILRKLGFKVNDAKTS